MMRLFHVDVFSSRAFFGNPLAVVVCDEAAEIATEHMQRIANWLNLSETTFVQPAADGLSYSVRIFTPKQELPFAGHPSLGSAAALFAAGALSADATHYIQHCAAGALGVWRDDATWFVQAPSATLTQIDTSAAQELAQICQLTLSGSAPAVIALGPRWAVAEFSSPAALLAAQPDFAALAAWNLAHNNIGLAAFARGVDDAGEYLEVRCFVPLDGISEDPVTGSGNAAIAAFLHINKAFGSLPRDFPARQGRAMGRDGRLQMRVSEAGAVAVGGVVTQISAGHLLTLPSE
jgi:PhzF family phenazine biosynthesis protein